MRITKTLSILFIFIFVNTLLATNPEDNIDIAYKNAMKGVYWAIDNIPTKKESLTKDLISDNINICTVKISVENCGVKITSTGYHNSNSVEIITYKSTQENKKQSQN